MNFYQLSEILKDTNEKLFQNAIKAVNVSLTFRNWLFGFYIVEFEQNGEDRAFYGSNLMQKLTSGLAIKGLSAPELSRCRQFYNIYPQILKKLPQEFIVFLPKQIAETLPKQYESQERSILGTVSQELEPDINAFYDKHLDKLITSISFSHWVELVKIQDGVKRRFYELLLLNTQPSNA